MTGRQWNDKQAGNGKTVRQANGKAGRWKDGQMER